MLESTAAFADLRALNAGTVRDAARQRETNLSTLIKAYGGTARPLPKSHYEIDVPSDYLSSAWVGDWESAYDIALRQLQTYVHAVLENRNPAWTAVTGYYAAFFAARALLFGVGMGHRTVPKTGIIGGGLYELSIAAGPTVTTSTLVLKKAGGGGSHKAAWRDVGALFARLQTIGGLDTRTLNIVHSTRTLISSPQDLSTFRNLVNYSLDIAADPPKVWASELLRIENTAELQAAVGNVSTPRGEHRIELLMLASVSTVRELYTDYLERAYRPDRRPSRTRQKEVAAAAPAVHTIVKRWA